MKYRYRLWLSLTPLFIFAACACGPASWAERLETQVNCGMSRQEVERLGGHEVRELHRTWATHYMGNESEPTQVWLTFQNDKLQSIQVAWMYKLKKMASAPRIQLCTPVPDTQR